MSNVLNVDLNEHILKVFHPLIFGTDEKEDILMNTGRVSGKSEAVAQKLVIDQLKNPNGWCLALRKTQASLKRSCIKMVRYWISKLGVEHLYRYKISDMTIERIDGAKGGFMFFGFDNEQKLRSTKFDDGAFPFRYWFEEFQENNDSIKLDDIEDLLSTYWRESLVHPLLHQSLYCINPKRDPNAPINLWIQKKIENGQGDPSFIRYYTSYKDLTHNETGKLVFGEQEYRKIERVRERDPDLYRWRYLGESVGEEDIIYKYFDQQVQVIETLPHGEWIESYYMTVDTGYSVSNNVIHVWGVTNKGNIVSVDGWYQCPNSVEKKKYPNELIKYMDFKSTVSPSLLAEQIEYWEQKVYTEYKSNVKVIVYDNADSGLGREYAKIYNKQMKPTRKGTKSNMIENSVGFLAENMVYAFDNNFNKIWRHEMVGYMLEPKSLGKAKRDPVKDKDHSVDTFQYFVNDIWKPLYEHKIIWNKY